MGVKWDPTDRSFKADPYPTYRAMLENEPLHHSPFGLTVISRYEDCMTVYRHPAASNDWRKSPEWEPTFETDAPALSFLFLDPPDHTRLRGLVSRAFTPKRVEQLLNRVDGAIVFESDAGRTWLSVKGMGDLPYRQRIEYRSTSATLVIGSLALERIR